MEALRQVAAFALQHLEVARRLHALTALLEREGVQPGDRVKAGVSVIGNVQEP